MTTERTTTYAVIIKHPFRDDDWRVDIAEVPDGVTYEEVEQWLYSEMLGPFQVMAITSRFNPGPRQFKPPTYPACELVPEDYPRASA